MPKFKRKNNSEGVGPHPHPLILPLLSGTENDGPSVVSHQPEPKDGHATDGKPMDGGSGGDSGMAESNVVSPLEGASAGEEIKPGVPKYRIQQGRTILARWAGSGETRRIEHIPLANFAARIAKEVLLVDGESATVDTQAVGEAFFEIEGWLADGRRLPKVRVKAAGFDTLPWVSNAWGAEAIIEAGTAVREHLRAAIQHFSKPVRQREFRHLGWTTLEGDVVYLHAGGGIGPNGSVRSLNIAVDSPLDLLKLPDPPEGASERVSVQQLLGITDIGKSVVWPSLLFALAAPLGPLPFSLFLLGPTGSRKTSLAVVLQSLFGFQGNEALLGWESTANALEAAAFFAKDTMLLIDDFVPIGALPQSRELDAKGARILRSQGNGTGRLRLSRDGALGANFHPRGALLITGEELPPGHSVRARALFVEVHPNALDLEQLSAAQALAQNGQLAKAFAGWVRKLASDLGVFQQRVAKGLAAYRSASGHGRTADAVATLRAVSELYLEYALEIGAIDLERFEELKAEAWAALQALALQQRTHQVEANPTKRFVELVLTALRMGRAHLQRKDGKKSHPDDPGTWGWRWHPRGSVGEWIPGGVPIGWLTDRPEIDGIFLDAQAAYHVANRLALELGERLPSLATLTKNLALAGMVYTADESGGVRRSKSVRIGNKTRRVLHLRPDVLENGNSGDGGENGLPDVEGADPPTN